MDGEWERRWGKDLYTVEHMMGVAIMGKWCSSADKARDIFRRRVSEGGAIVRRFFCRQVYDGVDKARNVFRRRVFDGVAIARKFLCRQISDVADVGG